VSDELRSELQLCPDICDSAEWSFPNKKVAEKGFLYCCSYQSFKDSIPWVDFLDNPAILVNRPQSKEIINHVPEPENRWFLGSNVDILSRITVYLINNSALGYFVNLPFHRPLNLINWLTQRVVYSSSQTSPNLIIFCGYIKRQVD
jgi:hypothetical protein